MCELRDLDDFEAYAARLEASGDYRILRRLISRKEFNLSLADDLKVAIVLDVETTGLDTEHDEIFEIGMVKLLYSPEGSISKVIGEYVGRREPSLPIPARVARIGTVAGRLLDSRVNLVAGLDYTIEGAQIRSSAVLVLGDERLGYSSSVQIRQWKSLPAAKEEMDLLLKFGKTWKTDTEPKPKPIYIHGGFAFGLLVCSELQNVQHRLNFQGKVDGLMILSWNQDLETFSALVESASLDVHAAIALVNNREFGDSRVRVPAKKSYERDLCRIRGGLNEHLVVVELDVQALRSFQSRATRAPSSADRFKPVPEGFSIANYRKTIPT